MHKDERGPLFIFVVEQWHSWTFILGVVWDGTLGVLTRVSKVDAILKRFGR